MTAPGDDLTIGATPSAPKPAAGGNDSGIAGAPQIPDVTIVRTLGKGGMGVVYAGRQSYLDRDVAVKVLSAGLVDPSFADRFRREAKILAGMKHQNVVACYSAGVSTSGTCYLVMEMIDGPSLAQWLKEHGAIAPKQALAIARDVAAALDHAHHEKIIHRDVKPENVLLARKKGAAADDPFPFTVKLADLGLARSTADDASMLELTAKGAVLGTPTTMSPEQFEDPDSVDWRSDVYGLGCVLFHCLTGRQAFPPQATLAATFTQKLTPKSPDPRELRADLDPRIAAFVMRLIAKKREDRPQSYAEIIAECDRLIAGGAAGTGKGSRGKLIAVAAGVLAIAGVTTWWTLKKKDDGLGPQPGVVNDPTPEEPPKSAPEPPTNAPEPPTAPPKPAFLATQSGAELADAGEVFEGLPIELTARVDSLPKSTVPVFTWESTAPRKLAIEHVAGDGAADAPGVDHARLLVPRGLREPRVAVRLAVGGADELAALAPIERSFAIAADPRVAEIETALRSGSAVDLLRRFSPENFGEGVDDPNSHRSCTGDGADFATWSLPRGDWRLVTSLHVLNLGAEATAAGVRIEFGDGFGLEVRLANDDPRPESGHEWSVVVGECSGATSAAAIELPAVGGRFEAPFTLAPNRMTPMAAESAGQDDDEPTEHESQDVLRCTIRFAAATDQFTLRLEQRREVNDPAKGGWIELPEPRKSFEWTRSRSADLERDPAFLPCAVVLWKTHGGLCVHELTLER